MWATNFMQVVDIQESSAVFYDEAIGEFVYVSSVSEIIQFEIDVRYMNFEPHFHYEVTPAKS